jgi:PAS domain S-box-containing protein
MLAASAESLYPDPEGRQRFVARLQREGRVSAEEVLLRRADGTSVWVLRDAALVREGEREIIEGVLLDWSSPHRAQEQVRLLAHALRSISECVSITDAENRLLFVNEAFLRTYGYSWEELAGQHISVVRVPGEPGPSVEETLAKTLAGGFSGELWNHRKSCQRFLVRLSTSVVQDEAGNPLALIGVARDITEERKKEEALRWAQKVVMSGYSLDPSRFGEGVPPGARFLQKPFTLTELAATLANLLRH